MLCNNGFQNEPQRLLKPLLNTHFSPLFEQGREGGSYDDDKEGTGEGKVNIPGESSELLIVLAGWGVILPRAENGGEEGRMAPLREGHLLSKFCPNGFMASK